MADHGSRIRYRQHVRRGEVTWQTVDATDIQRLMFRAALDGRVPAEALDQPWRDRLVTRLHRRGWTDMDIAAWTRTTTYTIARIRGRLGLTPNRRVGVAA